MKVFISWSGEESRKVASAFREWLPSVIQQVEPYFSPQDIEKGARWSNDIAVELETSDYGIICVTKENITAPWINFEAGALSKKVDKSRVTPFLFRIKPDDFAGPLRQFQCAVFTKAEIKEIVLGINSAMQGDQQLSEAQLNKAFEVWWPILEKDLSAIIAECEKQEVAVQSGEVKADKDYFEEILGLVRQQLVLLNRPDALLPPGYFEHLSKTLGFVRPEDDYHRNKLMSRAYELASLAHEQLEEEGSKSPEIAAAQMAIAEIRELTHTRDFALARARRAAGAFKRFRPHPEDV